MNIAQQIKQEEIETTLRTALAAGYRSFDCALLYGNEEWIGEAFDKIFTEGKFSRNDVFLTTKVITCKKLTSVRLILLFKCYSFP